MIDIKSEAARIAKLTGGFSSDDILNRRTRIEEAVGSLMTRVQDEQREGEYALAKQDHAYATGFQAGLILATNTEQSRTHWTTSGLHHDEYSEDYKQQIAAVERQRAEALKIIRDSK